MPPTNRQWSCSWRHHGGAWAAAPAHDFASQAAAGAPELRVVVSKVPLGLKKLLIWEAWIPWAGRGRSLLLGVAFHGVPCVLTIAIVRSVLDPRSLKDTAFWVCLPQAPGEVL